jgi:hypothetical protein
VRFSWLKIDDGCLPAAPDFRDKWRFLFCENRLHFRQGLEKDFGQCFCAEIAVCHEDKRANLCSPNRFSFCRAVANAFISRDDNPAAFSGCCQPFRIDRIRREVVVVDENIKTGGPEDSRELVAA